MHVAAYVLRTLNGRGICLVDYHRYRYEVEAVLRTAGVLEKMIDANQCGRGGNGRTAMFTVRPFQSEG